MCSCLKVEAANQLKEESKESRLWERYFKDLKSWRKMTITIRMLYFFAALFLGLSPVQAKECGPSQQLVLSADRVTKSIEMKFSKSHKDYFCSSIAPKHANTTIRFLNSKKKLVVEQKIFVNTNLFYDVKTKGKAKAGVKPQKKITFTFKYPRSELLKQAEFLEVIIDREGSFGTVRLK